MKNILLALKSWRNYLIAFFGVILFLSAFVLFFPLGKYSSFNSYRLDYSIYSHAHSAYQSGIYRPDFTDSIDIVEEMIRQGEAEEVVAVLVNNIQSRQLLRQMTAMLLLSFVDKMDAMKAIPTLKMVASDESENDSIRSDAQATIDILTK